MSDGYLSRDKVHLAKLQRDRRAAMRRIDYMPGSLALTIFEARQELEPAGGASATNSAVLDAILIEWAELTGIEYKDVAPLNTSVGGLKPSKLSARTPNMHTSPPELRPTLRAPARAYDYGEVVSRKTLPKLGQGEVKCGAARHRDGQPCQATPEQGKRRCRFHGGRSTGPKTAEGKARAMANLRQYAVST
ncbi:HGGxSTG domain-containing protein [Stenotrophomonas sp. Iso1]|uniref:HGGxSTG domain-containing protein n=1 Tax=Stenotrophomonas sp. Iso1 TaxID=2977283 RepID=UPI0022B7D644|nr:HGGxSTG domain-containing protein [Stenotrophomonas sp. Iso1]